MRRAVTLTIMGLTLLLCGVAHADTISDALPIARAQWPDSPCEGVEQVTVGDASAAAGTDAWGAAWQDGSCRVIIDTRIIGDPYETCIVLSHELGHLAGYGHADDGIMREESVSDYPPCYPFRHVVTFSLADAAVAVPINGHWRVRCSRTTDISALCVGRLKHHAKRYWLARMSAAGEYAFERL